MCIKTLSDGTPVVARTYYYLLDFNEVNGYSNMFERFGKHRLCDLTISEYSKLFEIATKLDSQDLFKKFLSK